MTFIREKRILYHPGFISVGFVKILAIIFVPKFAHIQYFIPSLAQNLHSFIPTPGIWDMGCGFSEFPYGITMAVFLWPLTKLFSFWGSPSIGIGITVLVFDLGLYLLLIDHLKFSQKKTLWFYWASPILFFVNYVHGQLDLIPMFLLFCSISQLLKKRQMQSALLLGMAINAKANVLLAVPVLLISCLRQMSIYEFFSFLLLVCVTAIGCVLPFLAYPGYIQTVHQTPEIDKFFNVFLSYGGNYTLYAAPFALCLIYLKFFQYKKINSDLIIMYLGLIFAVTVVIITPTPGWYVWPLPFILFYFIKQRDESYLAFIAFNILYIVQFGLPIEKSIMVSSVYSVEDLVFTCLQATLMMLSLKMYFYGVRSNTVYRERKIPFLIGIGGNSGAGKDTYTKLVKSLIAPKKCVQIDSDDDHKWERYDDNWHQYTHLNPSANNLNNLLTHVNMLKRGQKINRRLYDHETGKFKLPQLFDSNRFVFIQGLHPFYLRRMREIIDLRVFLEPDESLRIFWKIKRDVLERGYTKEQVLKSIEERDADAIKYIIPQRDYAHIVIKIVSLDFLEDHAENLNFEPRLKMTCRLDNSLFLEDLCDLLSKENGAVVKLYYDEDLMYQNFEYYGNIKGHDLGTLAQVEIPNIEELVEKDYCWGDGIQGVIQYITFKYISDILQMEQSI